MDLKLTHTVFKNEDIEKYLSEEEKMQLHNIDIRISHRRYLEGKKSNRYLVCNTDEPYAENVLKVIQKGEYDKNPENRRRDEMYRGEYS